MLKPILFAVPVFLVMMAAECAVARHRGVVAYRTADTVPCLSLGIVSPFGAWAVRAAARAAAAGGAAVPGTAAG